MERNLREVQQSNGQGREYLEVRYKTTLDYLSGKQVLSSPYVISADLGLSPGSSERQEGVLCVNFVEAHGNTQGIMIRQSDAKATPRRLPVFQYARPPYVAQVMSHERVSLVLTNQTEAPQLEEASGAAKKDGPVGVIIPRPVLARNLQIAVYDDQGNESNWCEVFLYGAQRE
jgi:hypothetical protein